MASGEDACGAWMGEMRQGRRWRSAVVAAVRWFGVVLHGEEGVTCAGGRWRLRSVMVGGDLVVRMLLVGSEHGQGGLVCLVAVLVALPLFGILSGRVVVA